MKLNNRKEHRAHRSIGWGQCSFPFVLLVPEARLAPHRCRSTLYVEVSWNLCILPYYSSYRVLNSIPKLLSHKTSLSTCTGSNSLQLAFLKGSNLVCRRGFEPNKWSTNPARQDPFGIADSSDLAGDTHKCRGSQKSLMGNITQIYSSTQGEQTRILARL
jgi:hypothetical protein